MQGSITIREALNGAMEEEMKRDERVFIMGAWCVCVRCPCMCYRRADTRPPTLTTRL